MLSRSDQIGVAGIGVTLLSTALAVLGWTPEWTWIVAGALGITLLAVAGVGLLRGHPGDRWEQLRRRLAEVDRLRTWLILSEEPDRKLPFDDDRVYQWAKVTFNLLRTEFPEEADAFMGEDDASLGGAHFGTAYALRRGTMGRTAYLESRAAILRAILRDRPSTAST
jgi:hypothetical protein